MKRKNLLSIIILLALALSACSGNPVLEDDGSATAAVVETQSITTATEASAPAAVVSETVTTITTENGETHEQAGDYEWDAAAVVPITLNGDSISADNSNVTIDGQKATITAAGTYSLSGTLADGQIVVDTQDEGIVRIILNGVEISNASSSPIYVENAEKTIIILAENTENNITDASSYTFENADEDEPNAALFSKSDLSIYGSGSLTVTGNYNDGIASKDGLIITSGSITVNAVDDGIRGKDYLVVEGGVINITAQGDGLKSDNEEDASLGFINISSGSLNITAGGDAISALTDVIITGGDFSITTANGSGSTIDETVSAKGIKGTVSTTISGGTFFIDSADDAIHSNGTITIDGGTYEISSGDDGMHSDSALTINNGQIDIRESYEGLESALITINNGNISIVSSDDGINVAGGADSSGFGFGKGGDKQIPGSGQASQDTFASLDSYYLYINGGYIYMNAQGDGLDSNGNIQMTNGTVIVNGPTESMNGSLDYMGSFSMTGGLLIAAGSAGMAMTPDQTSSINSVLITFSETISTGTLVNIQTDAGDEVLTFESSKEYQSLLVSSPELVNGTTYQIYTGGSSSGTQTDGVYENGGYTAGEQYDAFTVTSAVTYVGTSSFSGGGGGGGLPGGGGGGGGPRK